MEIDGSKKRKLICLEEDEEAKMETFFALVRNIRDRRDRWMGLMRSCGDSKSRRGEIITAQDENRSVVGVWKPTFQLEDFADEQSLEVEPSLALSAADDSEGKNCEKEEAAEKGIDLKLSLSQNGTN